MSQPSQPLVPVGSALSAALRAALVDPESWREGLEAFAHSTHLAVALVDAAGHQLGPCLNPRPLWSRLHAALGAAGVECPFALVPSQPCTCVRDALARQDLVLVRDRTGLVHFTVPLVLDGCPVGALLAGQVFDQYPERLKLGLEHAATHGGLSPQALWQVACLEPPITQATLQVYSRLLGVLGQAFLLARSHTFLEAQRLAALEQRFQERTIALHHEIAERQRLEREAQRAEHFALLGRLAAGVSHEIRNPLAAIFLHVEVLEEERREPSPDSAATVTETLAEIKTNLARLDDLVQDYLTLVRVTSLQREEQDLGQAVQTWGAEMQRELAARGVTLQLQGLEAVGQVAFHGSTLRRALLNLVQNAAEAMPQGGTVTLAGQSTATQVQLTVQDTGSGIASAQRARIFEPLYTTKPGGTGLGLYIVQEIVAAHGGQVTVESVEGQGTTVTVILPRVVGEAGLAPA